MHLLRVLRNTIIANSLPIFVLRSTRATRILWKFTSPYNKLLLVYRIIVRLQNRMYQYIYTRPPSFFYYKYDIIGIDGIVFANIKNVYDTLKRVFHKSKL